MSGKTLNDDGTANDQDWVVVPPHEGMNEASESRTSLISPIPSDYINFQLRTRFGTFSFAARPGPQRAEVTQGEQVARDDKAIPHPQEQSPLFRLPIDIRLEIYEHLLRVPPSDSNQAAKLARRSARSSSISTRLTVLLTCRRVLREAEGIFYSINRFRIESPNDFLSTLGSRRRCAMKKFTLPVISPAALLLELEHLSAAVPRLSSLYIQRMASVKYLDVSGWVVMAPQLVAKIQEMKNLTEVKILTPDSGSLLLREYEVVRKRRLDGIDLKITSAATLNRVSHFGVTSI